MTAENSNPTRQRAPWNRGRQIGQKRPLKPKDVWTIRVRLQMEGRRRDLAMFNLAIDSKLRGCDLVRLTIDDVFAGGGVRDRATVIQKKTGRPVQFEVTEQTRAAVGEWLAALDARESRYLFPSRFQGKPHLSTRQICSHRPSMGGPRRARQLGIRHALFAPNEAGTDLQEDRQPASGAAAAWSHEAGEHRALSRDRG